MITDQDVKATVDTGGNRVVFANRLVEDYHISLVEANAAIDHAVSSGAVIECTNPKSTIYGLGFLVVPEYMPRTAEDVRRINRKKK